MENPELSLPGNSDSDLASLRAQYASLRQTVVSLLILVIILSGAFNLFLLRQVNYARKDLDSVRREAAPIITDYQTNSRLVMDTFIQKLTEYGRAHADFQPIMAKYGIDKPASGTPGTPAPTGAAPAAPKPTAPAPAQKK